MYNLLFIQWYSPHVSLMPIYFTVAELCSVRSEFWEPDTLCYASVNTFKFQVKGFPPHWGLRTLSEFESNVSQSLDRGSIP